MRGMIIFLLAIGFQLVNKSLFPQEIQQIVLGATALACLIGIVVFGRRARKKQREAKLSLPLFTPSWTARMAGAVQRGSPAIHAILFIVFCLLVALYIWIHQSPH